MATNWGQMYSQGSSYVPQEPKLAKPTWRRGKKRKKQSYTVKKNDNVWSIADRFSTTPEELLGLNKVNKLRPGQVLNIYQPVQTPTNNAFNQAQQRMADRRDKRQYNPQGIGGIRNDWYGTINNPQTGETLFSSLPYQTYRLNWFAEQGILPMTVNTWVADELGYTDLLKEYGYKLNTNLNRWERPNATFGTQGGGGGSGGGYGSGGGGGRRGGGGGGGSGTPYPQDAGMGFGGTYNQGGYGNAAPRMAYSPRGVTQSGRKWGGAGLVNWRI